MTADMTATTTPSTAFDLLPPDLQQWVWEQRWDYFHAIQEEAIFAFRETEADLLIAARTAGGKSEAALLPACADLLSRGDEPGIGILYIAPLRALINDQALRAEDLFGRLDIRVTPWHSDRSRAQKKKLLADPSGIVLITPESLEHIVMTEVELDRLFQTTRVVVIDEIHAFAGTERGAQVQSLLSRIETAVGRSIRRVGLTGTAGDLSKLAAYLRPSVGNVRIIKAPDEVRPIVRLYGVEDADGEGFRVVTEWMTENLSSGTNLIFTNSRADVEAYADALRNTDETTANGTAFEPYHGSLSREHRQDVEAVLKRGDDSLTVISTSALELGIDIGAIGRVVQAGPIGSPSTLRQRLGRSGRRGTPPVIDTFVIETPLEVSSLQDALRTHLVQTIAVTDLMQNGWFEPCDNSALHLSTLVQQLLSLIAQRRGVPSDDAFRELCGQAGAFSRVPRRLFDLVVGDLVAQDLLNVVGGASLLNLTAAGEKLVSTRFFLAAFSTPVEFKVISENGVLGKLPLTPGLDYGSPIQFAGRRWKVWHIDEQAKTIQLKPAPNADPPRFLGSAVWVDDRVRQQMLSVYRAHDEPTYADAVALGLLREGRETFRAAGLGSHSIISRGENSLVFPWAGDRVVNTMVLQLLARGKKAFTSGVAVAVRKITPSALQRLAEELADDNRDAVDLARLSPTLRRHKHHRRLSDATVAEDYASEFIDLVGARKFWRDVAETP